MIVLTIPVTPLSKTRTRRVFYALINMSVKKSYNKPALSLNQQLELLISRGLIISDQAKVEHYLKFIGYYRLSGYMLPFCSSKDCFKPGVNFEQIIDLYKFDRKLRLFVFDSIEIIEVALRAVITDSLSLKYCPHWFADESLFEAKEKHALAINIIRKTTIDSNIIGRDSFIAHYYTNYTEPELPPSWMTLETLSIGALSIIFKSLKRDIRKLIATEFKLDEIILSSWLHSLTYTRNLAAHHARVWNRKFTIKPKILKRHKSFLTDDTHFFAQYVSISYILKTAAPNYHWKQNLINLFSEFPDINIGKMGFPPNWQYIEL
jgi:abortive infection bacteriophage resistance protein